MPVLSFWTSEFPAFYSRSSGLPVDARVDTPEEVAGICRSKRGLDLEGGVLIPIPVPADHEVPREVIEQPITAALADARREGITGKAVRPYLLAWVNAHTGGAALAARIACTLAA